MSSIFQRKNLRLYSTSFLYFVIIIETMYIVYNFGPKEKDVGLRPMFKLRRTFTHPVNFTQHEICMLENGFDEPDHPLLLERLRSHWIHKPSHAPLKLAKPDKTHFSQHGQSIYIDEAMKQKTNGFFIEAGAFNGEDASNSLFFERSRNWTGLLVEALIPNFQKLLTKSRNVYSINACLNTKNTTGRYQFYDGAYNGLGSLVKEVHKGGQRSGYIIEVPCFPLQSILRAIDVTHIDFFSLDVEGAELGVLQTIPFSYISVDFFLIEYRGKVHRYIEFDRYMTGLGYELVNKTFLDLLYKKKQEYT